MTHKPGEEAVALYRVITKFYQVLPGFYRVLPSFYLVLPIITWFYSVFRMQKMISRMG